MKLSYYINLITLLRIVGIPFLFFLKGIPAFAYLNLLFLTDYLDGFLARKYKQETQTGAILDLIADKFLVIFLLVLYVIKGKLLIWISILLIIREIYSILMRFYYLKLSNNKKMIKASRVGKTKTFFQFIAFDALILSVPGYQLLFIVVIVLSYYSLFQYAINSFKGGQ